jgi:hypothetical protein
MRMLDLFCGDGLTAWGYWRSGRFHEIVGMDIDKRHERKYAFDFICSDALQCDYNFLMDFDFIHASPPCQAYSTATPDKSKHPKLILPIHVMLYAAGVPYVIENVEGSSRELRPNIVMDGNYFGLPIERRRYFHASTLVAARFLSNRPGSNMIVEPVSNVRIHTSANRKTVIQAMGLEELISSASLRKISVDGMLQGVPPIMTKTLAELIFPHKAMIG